MTPESVMTPPPPHVPAASFVDPRTRADFQGCHWPLCNGGDAPPAESADPHDGRCLEVLAAYYEVNCRRMKLEEARARQAPEAETGALLGAVDEALCAVDAIEDRYASIGFYGEPTMRGDYYHSIGFHRPELPRVLPSEPSCHSFATWLAVPGLDEIPRKQLAGPTVLMRVPHGKVDL